MNSAKLPFLAAPLLLGAYGVIRILDGLDGSRGPGIAWTVGHLCFLAALAFFVRAFSVMRTLTDRNLLATTSFWVAAAGIVAVAVQFGIDIVVGFMSADRAEMGGYFDRIRAVPGIEPAFYSVGPMLFFLGQFVLVTLLATRRTLKPWAPILVLIDTTLPFADKDLIPLGAVLLLISFLPLIRSTPEPLLAAS